MNRVVYAGSFDPITNGHLWMIDEGARLFDELIVAIGTNPDKRYRFNLDARLEMLRECTSQHSNVTIDSFENQFLVDYASRVEADCIMRGIRDVKDYEYEKGMRHVNADLQPGISTVFLIPPRELTEVSSSFVTGLVGPSGWEDVVGRYVPASVFERILKKHGTPEH